MGHITDRYPYEDGSATENPFPPVYSSTPVVGQVWKKGNRTREVMMITDSGDVVYRDIGDHLHQVSIVSWKRWFRVDKRRGYIWDTWPPPPLFPRLVTKVK